MQIEKLILYNRIGKIRTLNFKLGALNIITGKSKSGKSAVGDIIEYCLGGEKCNIADGIVRKSVSWYGLLLNFETEQLFVARKNPELGVQSTSLCYYEAGEKIKIPLFKELISNTNVKGIEELINRRLNISANLCIQAKGQNKNFLSANVRHALYYCFQGQDEIAARNILFHRQSEPFITQTIKDTLPYFLGAINEDTIILESELKNKKHELAFFKRKQNEVNLIIGKGNERAISLLNEAISVGLIKEDIQINKNDLGSIIQLLSNIKLDEISVPLNDVGQLKLLKKQLEEEEKKLFKVDLSIKQTKIYLSDFSGYSSEAEHQKVRLESIGLFEKLDFTPNKCPFCSGDLHNTIPKVEMVKKAIISLNKSIKNVHKEKPKLEEYLNKLYQEQSILRIKIREIKQNIDIEYNKEKENIKIKDINIQRGKVIGRISLWLESIDSDTSFNSYTEDIKKLQKQIEEIKQQISFEVIEEKMDSILAKIQNYMTLWASKSLKLEYDSSPYRYDAKKVTVVVDRDRPIPLQQMGSGSNWVGIHLITYLAFQKYFIEENRPVPKFLFLDQPSQVYFPSSIDKKDIDVIEVSKLYTFINEQVDSHNGRLQVIVVDHAKLEEDIFTKNIIENWWDESKLIPEDWYN